MPAPRIVFMGTPDFAVPSLETLATAGYPIVGVVTGADKPRGRGREISPTAVKNSAQRLGLPVHQPESLQDPAFVRLLETLAPDLIVVVAFRILPPAVFTLPRLGAFNLHASLLPRYRGAAPINWAIINGERETGVTTFFLEEHVDTGTIILQAGAPITPEDDAGSLHDRLSLLGAGAVLETVRRIEAGTAVTTPQDPALASRAPKIHKEDCRVAWDRPAARVRDLIRGLAPLPGAWTTLEEKTVKLYRSEVAGEHQAPPGTLSRSGDSLFVQCADRLLRLAELQTEGRRRMNAAEFLRGNPLQSGQRFA